MFSHRVLFNNITYLTHLWFMRVPGGSRGFHFSQTTDCASAESIKSIKTIFIYWTTEISLGRSPWAKTRKKSGGRSCVFIYPTLRQTLTACQAARPYWHFIFHLASLINHSTPVQCNTHGHPPLLEVTKAQIMGSYRQRQGRWFKYYDILCGNNPVRGNMCQKHWHSIQRDLDCCE